MSDLPSATDRYIARIVTEHPTLDTEEYRGVLREVIGHMSSAAYSASSDLISEALRIALQEEHDTFEIDDLKKQICKENPQEFIREVLLLYFNKILVFVRKIGKEPEVEMEKPPQEEKIKYTSIVIDTGKPN